jgi:hypothetical protein
MQLVGGNPAATATAVEPLVTKVNYFLGNDPNEWHTNIPTFGKVQYDDVYPGIDLVYYGNGGNLEYDFVVSPGADPDVIALNFSGADDISIADDGALVVRAGDAEIRQPAPFIYQEIGGTRQQIAGSFSLSTQHSALSTDACATGNCLLTTVYFDVGSYDSSRPLVIDPLVLGYSTYLGAAGALDVGWGITVGDDGFAYVTGETRSAKFPATDGAFDESYNEGGIDAFVAKLNADGSGLVYATYLGGRSSEQGRNIAIDAAGNAYVTGNTRSRDFPTTPGAFQTSLNTIESYPFPDGFVTKLSPDGSELIYSTFLGGSDSDGGSGIAVDAVGNAYVLGGSSSDNFPVTSGAFQPTYHGNTDLFITKLNVVGSGLEYSSYLGGSDGDGAGGIAIDAVGTAYLTGYTRSTDFPTTPAAFDESYNGGDENAYVAKLTPDGSALAYSTFLGGSDGAGADDIVVDGDGNAYVVGTTRSVDFPVTPRAFDTVHQVNDGNDGFLTKLNAAGSGLAYSTFLSGGSESAQAIALDSVGNAYVAGYAASGLATTPDAFQKMFHGSFDAFLMNLNPAGSALIYSTYVGGSNSDIARGLALDVGGNAYVTGETRSGDFPTTPNALKRRNRPSTVDAFVTKFAAV